MKKYNEKNDVIFDCYFMPKIKAEEGEKVPHETKVQKVFFLYPQFINGQESFIKIEMPKEMILELAAEIRVIETEIVDLEYSELPW